MSPNAAIHVIDDDAAVRDSLSLLLECHGIPAHTYVSGSAVLDNVGIGPDDHLLIDVIMPDLNGPELLARLRARGVSAPAVFMTGAISPQLQQIAARTGAIVLEKPFSADELFAALDAR